MTIQRPKHFLLLPLLFLYSLQSPLFAQAENQKRGLVNWMEQNQSKLCQKKLSQLVFPGTHNSGASHLKTALQRPKNDRLPPDTDAMKRSLSLTGPIYRAWSQCQNKTVKEQLADGIRAFDLRVARDKKGVFHCCHGLYGERLDDVLKAVSDFTKAYPKELILLDFAKFYAWKPDSKGTYSAQKSMSDSDHKDLTAKIEKAMGQTLLGPTIQETTGAVVTWDTTLERIWKSRRSIIVHYSHSKAKAPFWRSKIQSTWANTWKRQTMKTRLSQSLARTSTAKFVKLNGEATPDQALIVKSLDPFGNFPKNLRQLARQTNPVFFSWILKTWKVKQINIVQVDHYDQGNLVRLCLILNDLASETSLPKTQKSHWGQWESGASRLRSFWKRRKR